jgi:ribosome-associated protein
MPMERAEENAVEISKTRRKRAMEELQAMGEALAALPDERLKKIELPEVLREAIALYRRMSRQDEARRRQGQYIGRLMRQVEEEPIRAALAEARGDSAAETAGLHRIERLRAALLEDETTLSEILALYPGIDPGHLRSLRRAALKEKAANKPPRNFRAIFRILKDVAMRESDEKTINHKDI